MSIDNLLLVSLIDILGFVQGCLLGIILLSSYRKNIAFFFLGLFLLGYSAELIISAIEIDNTYISHPWLYFIPLRFFWLFMPALFLYLKSISGRMNWQKDWAHLLPGIIEFSLFGMLFLFPSSVKQSWIVSGLAGQIDLIHILISAMLIFTYSVAIILYVKKHRQNLLSFHSSLEDKNLRWVSWIAIYVLFTLLFYLPNLFIDFPYVLSLTYSIINVCFIFWVALNGFKQLYVQPVGPTNTSVVVFSSEVSQSTVSESNLDARTTEKKVSFDRVRQFMLKQQPYRNSHLTLAELAKQLSMPQRELSECINHQSGQNFNQFVNFHRIEDAKRLLKDATYAHFTILGIGFEVGFSSKSSFNTTFKQVVGMTPSAYQKAG